MLITPGLGVVADMADKVLVIYGGRCVETGQAYAPGTIPRADALHMGAAHLHAAHGHQPRTAGADPGQPALPAHTAQGMRVPARGAPTTTRFLIGCATPPEA